VNVQAETISSRPVPFLFVSNIHPETCGAQMRIFRAVEILRNRKLDVLTVEEKKSGHPDESHTAEALRLGRVLIACD